MMTKQELMALRRFGRRIEKAAETWGTRLDDSPAHARLWLCLTDMATAGLQTASAASVLVKEKGRTEWTHAG